MSGAETPVECPAELLKGALEMAGADDVAGLARIEALLSEYGADPRLHFLKGSLLAAQQRYGEAHAAMARSIEIAPGFDAARFQLGLLELTSGNAGLAEGTWGPLHRLPPDHALRLFSTGLMKMARDDFDGAVAALREGIERNADNAALSRDMQMVVDTILARSGSENDPADAPSGAHLLLQKYGKGTKH